MINVFLSASIPMPTDKADFYGSADVMAIREAIKALVEFVVPRGTLTFGGHPAITPLVALYLRDANLEASRVSVYQSDYFQGRIPPQIADFVDVRYTKPVGTDEKKSLLRMREEMISSRTFNAAVIIGGDGWDIRGGRLIFEAPANSENFPVASTGAAAKRIFEDGNFPSQLATELTYPTLYRRMLDAPVP